MRTKNDYILLLQDYFRNTASHYGVIRMALFGSVARGEHTPESDIDVAYEGKPNLFLRIRMKEELEAIMKHKVDIVRLGAKDTASALFNQEISKDLLYV